MARTWVLPGGQEGATKSGITSFSPAAGQRTPTLMQHSIYNGSRKGRSVLDITTNSLLQCVYPVLCSSNLSEVTIDMLIEGIVLICTIHAIGRWLSSKYAQDTPVRSPCIGIPTREWPCKQTMSHQNVQYGQQNTWAYQLHCLTTKFEEEKICSLDIAVKS